MNTSLDRRPNAVVAIHLQFCWPFPQQPGVSFNPSLEIMFRCIVMIIENKSVYACLPWCRRNIAWTRTLIQSMDGKKVVASTVTTHYPPCSKTHPERAKTKPTWAALEYHRQK
jgi:hypothetical protein